MNTLIFAFAFITAVTPGGFERLATATPIRLTVQPKVTTQIEFTFGPVVPGVFNEILTRTTDRKVIG